MSRLLLGLDLGTTSLAGRLWTDAGRVLADASIDNPQQVYGADVIARMEAALAGNALSLQRSLVDGINQLLRELLQQAGGRSAQIVAAAAAANPAISLLLAGRSVARLLKPPYRPESLSEEELDVGLLGLELPVPVNLLPLVSGYVGGDLLAVLLGSPPATEPTLYIDIGTNAELALWDGAEWLVTSVAAGPAFEAGHLSCGMRYADGAVSEAKIVKDRFSLTVAGGGMPKGICGSGLFWLLNGAVQTGLITADGRIRAADEVDSNLSRYLVTADGIPALQVYRDARTCLRLTQDDVRAFQLAKGAVLAGVKCLLQRKGLDSGQITSVRLAGALGGALPPAALKGVAILPENMLEKCRFLPAVVLTGLLHVMQQEHGLESTKILASRLNPYPLSGTPAFENAFLASLDFSE